MKIKWLLIKDLVNVLSVFIWQLFDNVSTLKLLTLAHWSGEFMDLTFYSSSVRDWLAFFNIVISYLGPPANVWYSGRCFKKT